MNHFLFKPPSVHNSGGALAQWGRVCRWHERAKKALDNPESQADSEDFLYTFFVNCYHLKEWLEKEIKEIKEQHPDNTELKNSVQRLNTKIDLIRQHHEMQICRDLCNAVKHCTLSNPSLEHPISIHAEYSPDKPRNLIIHSHKEGHCEYQNADTLIDTCFNLWQTFFKNNIDLINSIYQFHPTYKMPS